LRATDIELAIHRFGGEQWSELNLNLGPHPSTNVRAPVCRLLPPFGVIEWCSSIETSFETLKPHCETSGYSQLI